MSELQGGGLLFCFLVTSFVHFFFLFLEIPLPFLLATDGALQMALLPIFLSPPSSLLPPNSFLGGFRFLLTYIPKFFPFPPPQSP